VPSGLTRLVEGDGILVTCGGPFDSSARNYRANGIVCAVPP
jgi:hypothetical protein